MHELSLAINLKDMIEGAVKKEGCKDVSRIVISIGEFSNVYKDSLEFALDVVKKDTVFNNAEIVINIIKTVLKCNSCGNEFNPVEFSFICNKCGSAEITILQGESMTLESIEAE